MNESDFIRAIENNLAEAWRFLSHIPGVDYEAGPEMIRYIGGIPYPLCNSIMQANFPPGSLDEKIREAMAPITARQLPLFWWVGPATRPADLGRHLEKQGLSLIERVPGMAMDLRSAEENRPAPAGLTIREIQNREDLRAWIDVFRIGFETPEVAANFFHNAMSYIGLGPGLRYKHYLGLCKDEPVACSSVYLGDGDAGIYNVVTLPDFRGRGIGSVMTQRPVRVAEEQGLRIGVLHASAMGRPVYERLGFREYCRLEIYLWEP